MYFDGEKGEVVPFEGEGGCSSSLKSTRDKRGLVTEYRYDIRGNVEMVSLYGEDLTGDGQKSVSKQFCYNSDDLCIVEKTENRKKVTTYDSVFNYLPKRIESYQEDTLLTFLELEYNPKGQLIKESRAGALTLYDYDERGLPYKIIQKTGTSDPDLVTTFIYNHQGQCVEKITADGIQKDEYDTSGNRYATFLYAPSGKLLSTSYTKYNLNNQPILEYGVNGKDPIYFSYNALGLIKSKLQDSLAYTLYEYDTRGYLKEEVDPLGNCTYFTYDRLGRLFSVAVGDAITSYAYEAGGLIALVTTPSGAVTKSSYTINGLLKEEVYPDGSIHSFIYDFSGRLLEEKRGSLTFTTSYDELNNIVTKRLQDTVEVQKFDVRGNLLSFTDAYGHVWEKTYDLLNRITSEKTPTGEATTWSYLGDTVICAASNGEKTVTRYELGSLVESKTYSSEGRLLSSSSTTYDESLSEETRIVGDIITVTKKNARGKPLLVTCGDLVSSFTYDLAGNKIRSMDGDGRITTLGYDASGRLATKTLPDGALITYCYDGDSNLIECRMPGGLIWKASYDCMGRKEVEELIAAGSSSQSYRYIYEEGLLRQTIDPQSRIHTYRYDSYQRLIEESVNSHSRIYSYDLLGRLSSLEESGNIPSLITREYDPSGRICLESIYLDSKLLQQTKQTWNSAYRSLEIGDHKREFFYEQGQIQRILSKEVDLSYEYSLSRAVVRRAAPCAQVAIEYSGSPLPKGIHASLFGKERAETLTWNPSGKLANYVVIDASVDKSFSYNERGQLQSSDEGLYEFDFGTPGLGIRTRAPTIEVIADGIDSCGIVHMEVASNGAIETTYNAMGEVVSQDGKICTWDPWGRLLSITTDTYIWKASYDGFGRRLQTQYLPSEGQEVITTSFYDPEEEFREIGITQNGKTFWKIYGPNGCDAISEERDSAYLLQNGLGSLAAVSTSKGVIYQEPSPLYGPMGFASEYRDCVSYALSICWQNKGVDQTGFIWMGARYYDPKTGRFLSPDPISYPLCLDLYNYANGDPVNYNDPDGRFSSHAYNTTKSWVIDTVCDPRAMGYVQAGFGFAGVLKGTALMGLGSLASATGFGAFIGMPMAVYGGVTAAYSLDNAIAGIRMAISGHHVDTAAMQLLMATGMSSSSASIVDGIMGTTLDMGASRFGKGTSYISKFSQNSNYKVVQNASEKISTLNKTSITQVSSVRGWKVGQDITHRTAAGNIPKWSAVRQRYWKNKASNNCNNYKSTELNRMKNGLAPQRINDVTGKFESMELHHTPPKRDGGLFDFIEVWPDEHSKLDKYRHIGGG